MTLLELRQHGVTPELEYDSDGEIVGVIFKAYITSDLEIDITKSVQEALSDATITDIQIQLEVESLITHERDQKKDAG